MTRRQGAEIVNFDKEDPVKTILDDREKVTPDAKKDGEQWVGGDAPARALEWAIEALAKAGQLSIIGVYPPTHRVFPIGKAMNKNLTVKMGNCNHRRYYATLISLVQSGTVDSLKVLTQVEPMLGAIDAYQAFDRREPGWIKVDLLPA